MVQTLYRDHMEEDESRLKGADMKTVSERYKNVEFIANHTFSSADWDIEGMLIDSLKDIQATPKEERPNKAVLVYLDDREGGYFTTTNSVDVKASEIVVLLDVARAKFLRYLTGP